jgi:flagellar L-ring protein precursor FlgH
MKNRPASMVMVAAAFVAFMGTLAISGALGAQAAQATQPPAATRTAATRPAAGAAPQATQTTPVLTSTAVPGRQSWLSDRRDFHLGDIVTVLVDEYTLTSLDKEVNATENRQRNLGLGVSTPTSNKTFGVNSNNGNQSQNSGLDARTNRLTTDMSARVVAIAPNGVMQLKGSKIIKVEESKVNLILTGWVRVQDVAPDNSVQSFRMADADLDYQAEGPLGKAKSGIIGRLIGAFWP